MLKLHSVTFKDEETGKVYEVGFQDHSFQSNVCYTLAEYYLCNYYADLMLEGGITSIQNLLQQKK